MRAARNMVREWLPEAAIGADVIAGFPGETEEDHQRDTVVDRFAAAHLPARIFVFFAAGNCGGGTE